LLDNPQPGWGGGGGASASTNSVEILVARYQQNIMEISWCSLFHVTPQIFFSELDNAQPKFPHYLSKLIALDNARLKFPRYLLKPIFFLRFITRNLNWCYECLQRQYIGATSACSSNRRIHTGILQLKNFRCFFKCLQHQYIGTNRFAAPI